MTCGEFYDLASGDREYGDLTRAERVAVVDHLVGCRDCFSALLPELLDYLRAEPREAMAALAVGMEWRQRDKAAADPEANPV